MAIKTNKINIIDIEATCWSNDDVDNKTNNSEIIEIGIVQVDTIKLEIVKSKSYLVKPYEHPVLSDFCTELTTITTDMLVDAKDLGDAMVDMENEFETTKYGWGSWGDYDRIQFDRECKRKKYQYPFKTHINLKYVLATMYKINQRGVANMLKYLRMQFDGTPHRGIDDAINIAKIYIRFMKDFQIN